MVDLDGRSLTLAQVERVARDLNETVRLDPEAVDRIRRARAYVERILTTEERVYGVTTGFGRLADKVISREQQLDLQRNLIRSHAAGVGEALARDSVRALMVLRANALARGHSGCRVAVVERLLEYVNRGIHPVVPEAGSVGASGDLAPLAHVALTLMGEGEVELRGEIRATEEVLREIQMDPLDLKEKEGLALINGTQATTALGVLALLDGERALEVAEVAGAMSLEGLRGTPDAFKRAVHETRPHPGQIRSAARLWSLLQESEIRESHRHGDPRIQDAYSVRCMPQVHGAARQALAYVRGVLETEANSTTDNPLILVETDEVVSAGNFHAQVVAQALDFMVLVLADLASVSERRTERLLNPDTSGHPAFLTPEPGIRSGFMIAQVAAADMLAELRILAHPASVDSVPTSANQEDHVSMGMAAARKARRAVRCLEYVLAVELLCAAQSLEYLKPLRPGRGVEAAYLRIREEVSALDDDRPLHDDLEQLRKLIRSDELLDAIGPLEEEERSSV